MELIGAPRSSRSPQTSTGAGVALPSADRQISYGRIWRFRPTPVTDDPGLTVR
jgi:hypothetical protein